MLALRSPPRSTKPQTSHQGALGGPNANKNSSLATKWNWALVFFMQRKPKTRTALFERHKQDAKKPTFSVMTGGVSRTYRAGLHFVGLVQRQQAPLMDPMAAQRIDVALVVCRPTGATLDPEPRGRDDRPLRVGLPSTVEYSMRGDACSCWGSEA